MARSMEIVERLTDNLKKLVPDCNPDVLPQAVETATHIERAFFKHEIGEKERTNQYERLDILVSTFWTECSCERQSPTLKL